MPVETMPSPRHAAATELAEGLDKLPLLVQSHDYPATARQLAPILRAQGDIFERGGIPVRVLSVQDNLPKVVTLTEYGTVAVIHRTYQPVKLDAKGDEKPVTLPRDVARMYLDGGEFGLPVLAGVSMTPLVRPDGSIRIAVGYDAETGMWCVAVPELHIPDRPTARQARDALQRRRAATATLPYADGPRITVDGEDRVDLSQPPGANESAYLALQATAVIRSSLALAPGFAIMAPSGNGRGSGKGKAVAFACRSAYGFDPGASTAPPGNPVELEKRVEAELLDGGPVLFVDNINDQTFKCNQAQPAITQGKIRIRPLGSSTVREVRVNTLFVLTGNGLVIGGDLTRRILAINLDPRCENAETRRFKVDLLEGAIENRAVFLQDWLTITCWGYQNKSPQPVGLPFGFPDWERMVRDPLVQLGCRDPVATAQDAKQLDPEQRAKADLFKAWWGQYRDTPVTADELCGGPLELLLNPQARPRQWVASKLGRLADSRIAGFVMTCERNGKWSPATYSLQQVDASASNASPMPSPVADPPRPATAFVYQKRPVEAWRRRDPDFAKPHRGRPA